MSFIDSSALVPLFKEEDEFKKKTHKFFENFDSRKEILNSSVVCLLELRFVLKKFGKTDGEIKKAISAVLSMPIEFFEIDSHLIEDALSYIDFYNLEFFDAIIVASMVKKKDFSIISFDKDFDKVDFIKRVEMQ